MLLAGFLFYYILLIFLYYSLLLLTQDISPILEFGLHNTVFKGESEIDNKHP